MGPILLFAAIGMTATAMNIGIVREVLALEPFGQPVYELGRVMPYLLVIAAFTFIYMFIPNTKVEFGPALAGGIVGGVLWQSAGIAFAVFVASSTNYSAIYSGFAILILFSDLAVFELADPLIRGQRRVLSAAPGVLGRRRRRAAAEQSHARTPRAGDRELDRRDTTWLVARRGPCAS